jgi:hypothetical protein
MKKLLCFLVLSVGLLGFTGCAMQNSTGGVIPLGGDSYMIAKNSKAGAFADMSGLRASTIAEASAFAAAQGKTMEIISANTQPAAPGRFPSFECIFRLVDKK